MADFDLTSDISSGEFDGGGNASVPFVDDGTPARTPAGTVHVNADRPAPEAKPAAEKPASIRDQLTAAFGKTEEAPPADGRPRNPDGTFAAKPAEGEAPPAQEADPNAAPVDNTPKLPAGLPPEHSEQFLALPEEMQQFVARTMEHVNSQAARFGEYAQIEQTLIAPRRDAWAQNGATPAQAMQQLFNLSDFASTDPGNFVLWFADSQKLDLDKLLDDRDAAANDPKYARLLQENEALRKQAQPGNTETPEQQAITSLRQEVDKFSDEKDGAGQPLRPYWSELGHIIAPLVGTIRAENPAMSTYDVLTQAYQQACWASPAVRQKMQAAEEAQKLAQARQKTSRAREAGSSVSGAPTAETSAAPRNGARTVREELQYQFSRAQH